MNTYQKNHDQNRSGFAEVVVSGANLVIKAAENARSRYLQARNLRATETALEGLPEGIRHDIGWPDLYERHGSTLAH